MQALRRHGISIGLLAALLIVFFFLLNKSYPLLGQDYFYFFPRILAGAWHLAHAGLTPFRYIPFLCGGLPQYGNPQDIFYSVPQFLGSFVDLWTAMQLSIALMLVAGWAGWVRFGRSVLGLSSHVASLLALIILANGYYLLHMLIGHVTFQATPLIGWLLWLLLDPVQLSRRKLLVRASIFALLCALILYGGGYFVIIQAAILYIFLLPFAWRRRVIPLAAQLRIDFTRVAAFGMATLVLCASKLVAVYSVMRFFPRLADFSQFASGENIFVFIARTLWQLPQQNLLLDPEPYPAALHEYGMYASPVLLIGLIAVLVFFVRGWRSRPRVRSAVTVCAVIVLSAFFAQVTRGNGPLADWFHGLPAISSLRINTRFLYLAALLLSMAGVVGLERLLAHFNWQKRTVHVTIASGAITLVALIFAYSSAITPQSMDLSMPYDIVNKAIGENPGLLDQQVTMVEDMRAQQVSDFQYVLAGTTGFSCYEPLIAGTDILPQLTAGPVSTVTDGAYNLNNPACLQYPEANNCTPGDRIAVADSEQLLAFISGENPAWKTSSLQKFADLITILGLLSAFGLLGWESWKKLQKHQKKTAETA